MEKNLLKQKLLSLGTDRALFVKDSPVRKRQIAYAEAWEEVHIVVFAGQNFSAEKISHNCYIYPTNSKTRWLYPLDAESLGRQIVKEHGITHLTCQDPFLTAMASWALKKDFSLEWEIQLHTDIGSPHFARSLGNFIRKRLALFYLPRADVLRVVSGRIKRYLVEKLHIAEAKIVVRPIAVDLEAIKNTPGLTDLHRVYPQFKKIVLMASRLEPEKDIILALKSWVRVIDAIPQAGLIIVGEGSQKSRLEGFVRMNKLSAQVVFEPWVDKPRLYAYYKSADLFLLTSRYEGYGLTLVEAAAAACPIVATDVGVAEEVGAKIVAHHPASVAEGIVSVLQEKQS